MKTIKKFWYARPLSIMLSVLIAVTTLFLSFATAGSANAQQVSRAPFWAVLDFTNQTTYGGADIGREAGDALVLELGRTNRFNIINRSDVNQGLTALGIQVPLDAVDVQKLGRQLNADAIVTGNVLSITRDKKSGQVEAVIAVKVIDTTTGELINGALADGFSSPRNGASPDEDSLANEAISKAAFAAVKQITSYNLPEPTVLNNEGPDTVLLNKGSRDGVQNGMRLLVQRDGIEVGRLQVTKVDADDSTANVTETTLGIRPGDRGRAIYSLPAYSLHGGRVVTDSDSIATGNAIKAKKKSFFSGLGGVLLAVLATALLLSLINRGASSRDLSGATIGAVTAQAIFGTNGLPYPSTFSASDPNVANYYGVLVKWSVPNSINSPDQRSIIAFNIYRDNFQNGLSGFTSTTVTTAGSIGSAGSTKGSTSGSTNGATGIPIGSGPVETQRPGAYSVVDIGAAHGLSFYFVTPQLGGTSGSTSGNSGSKSSGNTSGSSSGSTSGSSVAHVLIDQLGQATYGLDAVPQLPIGGTTRYEVTAVYQVTSLVGSSTTSSSGSSSGNNSGSRNTSGSTSGSSSGSGYEETPITSSVSGLVTPILPIDTGGSATASSNNVLVNHNSALAQQGVNFTNVVFSFLTNPGADYYVVDVSSRPDFSNKVTLAPNPLTASANAASGQTVQTAPANLRTLFPGATTIYYRIGDRNSEDNPGPASDDSVSPNPDRYGNNNSTYLYSRVGFFTGS